MRLHITFAVFLALCLASLLPACSSPGSVNFKAETLAKLDFIRKERKAQALKRLERMMGKVRGAVADPVLAGAFLKFSALTGSGAPADRIAALEDRELDRAYLERYYFFYDILFIDPNGLVFYTIRRESDLGKNLFSSDLSSTQLAKKLASGQPVEFVDYHFYSPSKEPAAFFVAEVRKEGRPAGWMVFQYSAGALKDIMSTETGLGQTAEVYLANENKVMLTQSKLLPQGSPLSLRVETEASERAMRLGEGNGVILDYRGIRVFSSFDKFEFAGATWIIIAEVDEEEALTQFFTNNREYFYERAFKMMTAGPEAGPRPEWFFDENVKVDINEFASSQAGEVISTTGVTTCTAVALQYPGRFTYIGHIYPLDDVYYSRWEKPIVDMFYRWAGSVHGDGVADLMGSMIHEIQRFRVYPSETRRLQAVLIATHQNSFARITDRLLDSGLYLSQIKILNAQGMKYVDVAAEVNSGTVTARWVGRNGGERWTSAERAPTLETIMKQIIGYGEDIPPAL